MFIFPPYFQEVLRRDWMFKLVGEDSFYIDQARCIIRVDPAPGFRYQYSLYIDGKPHEQYTDELTKYYRLWLVNIEDNEYRIMLELDTINLYVNDQLRTETVSGKMSTQSLYFNKICSNSQGEFVDGGTDTKFMEDGNEFVLQARSSGNKLDGLTHTLLANGEVIPEAKIIEVMQEPFSILSST